MSRASERRVLDEAGGVRAMTWVMAIMLFLTMLAAALGLGTAGAARGTAVGIWLAIVSAAAFGTSGALAKSLLETGWSPGAAVTVRISGAALVLLVVELLARPPGPGEPAEGTPTPA